MKAAKCFYFHLVLYVNPMYVVGWGNGKFHDKFYTKIELKSSFLFLYFTTII